MMLLRFEDVTLQYTQFRWGRIGCVPFPGLHRKRVFEHLDWEVGRGRIVLLLADNGAGKSTLLRAAAGLLKPVAGRIVCAPGHGRDLNDVRTCRIGLVSDRTSYFHRALSVDRNLRFWAALHGLDKRTVKSRTEAVKAEFNLCEIQDSSVMSLSSGQYQRLVLAAKLLAEPQLLLLDEPWKCVDDCTRKGLTRKLVEYVRKDVSRSIVIASATAGWADECCDDVVGIEGGRLVAPKENSRVA